MNYDFIDYDKTLTGYADCIPSKYPSYNNAWDEEELETIEELNGIFNL